MLQALFPRDFWLYAGSRFSAELEEFAGWLQEHGHLRHPLRLHLHRAKQVLERPGHAFQSGTAFNEQALQEAFRVSGAGAYLTSCTGRIFSGFLASRGRLETVQSDKPLDILYRRYDEHLRDVRGFARQTRFHHTSTVKDFLARGLHPERKLSLLVADDVEVYVQLKSRENKRQSLQHVVAHLRAFLRFCGDQGEAPRGLSVIDTARTYRGELPPRALDWTLVRRLLASIPRRHARDWRDYAILHLMAFYGLRPSEVASLKVSSIDWENGILSVDQSKTRSRLALPLTQRTLRLLQRYVALGRPASNLPALFFRVRSPITPIKHYGVIEVFQYRARQSGLPLDGASSYALRHAFAMRLLQRGVGIKAIGDLLGHRSLEATSVYLRLDVDMLRVVGLPVPAAALVGSAAHV